MRNKSRWSTTGTLVTAVLLSSVLAACSGNMTGAAPPVQQVAAGSSTITQGLGSTTATALGTNLSTPIPFVSAEITLSSAASPLPLPTDGGYSGTIVAVVASPEPSADVVLGVTLHPEPSDAPQREGAPKKGATHPILLLEVHAEGGNAILPQGLGGVTFTLPSRAYATAKRFALALLDTDLPAQPRALFHRKKAATNALIAIDDKTKITKTGQTLNGVTAPLSLQAAHRYAFVLYADRALELATPQPGGFGAMPLLSPSPGISPSPIISGTPENMTSPLPRNSASEIPGGESLPAATTTPWLASTPHP